MQKLYILCAVLLVLGVIIRDTNSQFVRDFRMALKQVFGDYQEIGDVYDNRYKQSPKIIYNPKYAQPDLKFMI